jgi:streptomycin 6-kinase
MKGETMTLSNKQKEIILRNFGKRLYNEVVCCISIYTEKWQLENLALVEKPTRNLLLSCISPKYGSCMLKIVFDDFFDTEIEVLRAFNGRGYCRLYEYSIKDKVCLLEWILPGDDLFYSTMRDERVTFFSDLYCDWYAVPIESANLSIFPTFISLFEDNSDAGSWKNNCEFLHLHIEKAKEIILTLSSAYNPNTLLHGDLAYSNILKNKNGGYTAIDPIGIVGIPAFSITQFMLNEFGNALTFESIENCLNFINLISRKVSIPTEILKKCLYVETVLRLCRLEIAYGKKLKDYGFMIDNVLTAEKIMGDTGD